MWFSIPLKGLGRNMPKCSQELAQSGEFQVILISSVLFIFGALQIVYDAHIVESKKKNKG